MSATDWTAHPRQGLGRLEFGMSTQQVQALTEVYGAALSQTVERIPGATLLETLAMFGDAMSAAEKAELMAVYAELAPAGDAVSEVRDCGLVLGYEADALSQISVPATMPLLLDEHDLFSVNAMDAPMLLERLNDAPGRYASDEAAFDNLAISVTGFCEVSDDAVRALTAADETFGQRTVTLRAVAYHPENEAGRFITHRLLS